jgi:hypothetical protein
MRSGAAGVDLQDRPNRTGRWVVRTRLGRAWLNFGDHVDDPASSVQKDEIERDQHVLHPERWDARLLEEEEHPSIVGQGGTEHEAVRDLFGRHGEFEIDHEPVGIHRLW